MPITISQSTFKNNGTFELIILFTVYISPSRFVLDLYRLWKAGKPKIFEAYISSD